MNNVHSRSQLCYSGPLTSKGEWIGTGVIEYRNLKLISKELPTDPLTKKCYALYPFISQEVTSPKPLLHLVLYPTGEKYCGEVDSTLDPQGKGLLVRVNKGKIHAHFVGLRRFKPGHAIIKEGSQVYEGEINSYGLKHGQGVVTMDGKTFKGQFNHGSPTGKFEVHYPDQSKYLGEISALYEREGDGMTTKPNGDVYRGRYENDSPAPQAEFIVLYKNGDRYQGPLNFDEEKQGFGTFIKVNRPIFHGNFESDKIVEESYTIAYPNGLVYVGPINHDLLPTGNGTLTDIYDNQFQGLFIEGIPDQGTLTLKNTPPLEGSGPELLDAYTQWILDQLK